MDRTTGIQFIPIWLLVIVSVILVVGQTTLAQTTAFNYQGRLTDVGNPANGTYDMQFKLFDTVTVGTGTQQGSTITNPSVQVTGGSFAVNLDFGSNVFTGAVRFLEIGVRPGGSPDPYTTLAPRQPITSSPYAIQTVNTQQLGGLPASRYVATDASGNVGIGTGTPNSTVSTTNLPARLTVSGAGTFDAPGAARFDLFNTTANTGFLQHVTNTGLWQIATTSDGLTKMVITQSGNVGIGTTAPTSKLEIAAQNGLAITGIQPFLTLRDTISGGLRSIMASGDGDFGFYPNSFIGTIPAVVIKNNSGNVGIGPISPAAKLVVSGAGAFNASGAPRFDLFNTTANTGFLQHVTDSGLWQIGTTAGATRMVIDPNGSVGIGTAEPLAKLQVAGVGTNGFTLGVEGNVTQNRDKGGFAKAMVYVNGDGTILRCYNGLTGASSGNCGFSVTRNVSGSYFVDFNFQVIDRFLSLTVESNSIENQAGISYSGESFNDVIIVHTYQIGAGLSDRPFHLIVY